MKELSSAAALRIFYRVLLLALYDRFYGTIDESKEAAAWLDDYGNNTAESVGIDVCPLTRKNAFKIKRYFKKVWSK